MSARLVIRVCKAQSELRQFFRNVDVPDEVIPPEYWDAQHSCNTMVCDYFRAMCKIYGIGEPLDIDGGMRLLKAHPRSGMCLVAYVRFCVCENYTPDEVESMLTKCATLFNSHELGHIHFVEGVFAEKQGDFSRATSAYTIAGECYFIPSVIHCIEHDTFIEAPPYDVMDAYGRVFERSVRDPPPLETDKLT